MTSLTYKMWFDAVLTNRGINFQYCYKKKKNRILCDQAIFSLFCETS